MNSKYIPEKSKLVLARAVSCSYLQNLIFFRWDASRRVDNLDKASMLVKSNIDRRGAQFGVVIASSNIENTKLVDSAFTQ